MEVLEISTTRLRVQGPHTDRLRAAGGADRSDIKVKPSYALALIILSMQKTLT